MSHPQSLIDRDHAFCWFSADFSCLSCFIFFVNVLLPVVMARACALPLNKPAFNSQFYPRYVTLNMLWIPFWASVFSSVKWDSDFLYLWGSWQKVLKTIFRFDSLLEGLINHWELICSQLRFFCRESIQIKIDQWKKHKRAGSEKVLNAKLLLSCPCGARTHCFPGISVWPCMWCCQPGTLTRAMALSALLGLLLHRQGWLIGWLIAHAVDLSL